MKRLRSSDDDSFGEKGVCKDWGRKDENLGLHRSSSHRSFYNKSENGRNSLSSSSSRYDRSEGDRESSRSIWKRPDFDMDSYDRRNSSDRYRDGVDKGILSSSPRVGYGADWIHRSDSFSGPRREFPKGFRSERDRSRREGSVSSWRRLGGGKDVEEDTRSGSESARGSKVALDDSGKERSPQWLKLRSLQGRGSDAKSPPWSKDSGSEQSKSVEVKKSEDLSVDSGNSSEMEEGELEPEPATEPVPVLQPLAEDQAPVGLNSNHELDNEHCVENEVLKDGENSFSRENSNAKKLNVEEEKAEAGPSEAVVVAMKRVEDLPDCQNALFPETSDNRAVTITVADNEGGKDEECAKENSNCKEKSTDTFAENSRSLENEQNEDKDTNTEVKLEDIDLLELNNATAERSRELAFFSSLVTEEGKQIFKDKGESVAIPHANATDSADASLEIQRELSGPLACNENSMEGPSTRGFDFFLTNSVKKLEKVDKSDQNKPKDEKLALEPLELSLSLPNVLLPIGSQNTVQAPGSPGKARSVQSFSTTFQTNSDGFAASMSFSGSQHFTHNPSCSLTHNYFDNNEQSVHSRPIFQGVDWQGQSANEPKNKEVLMHQTKLSNENGFYLQSQASQGISNSLAAQVQQLKDDEKGSPRIPIGLDRQLSAHKQLSGAHSGRPNDARSPSHSVGSHETGSKYGKDKKQVMREKSGGSLYRSSTEDEKEQLLAVGGNLVEPMITMIASEPLYKMAKRFNDMTGQYIECLKESVRDIILNPDKQWQLCAFQKALGNRADIALETLLKSHRAQLEILVALKMGRQDCLIHNYDISSSDLAEIVLNLRCGNLTCRNLLPVDECDCKICAPKNGFCSTCMCVICLKFDTAYNTCGWVGCDVCLHWCHADCGLRESYISNGRSTTGAYGTTEMQFHCVACGHDSEMFGFVKEVFQNFAKEWTAETLSKELEYVRRIFCASEDVRGKRLHEIALQMLPRLVNKSELQEVQNHIIGFFTGSDAFNSGKTPNVSAKERSTKNLGEGSNCVGGSSQEPIWLKSVYSEKGSQVEKPANWNDKQTTSSNFQRSGQKEPVFDELESIVRMKQAEAKMFQARADDARRDAEGLKRIANAKNEKNEEEYMSRITKLRLSEADELHKQKFEELQAMERAHREYFHMKTRMEADIKDLLLKMEAARRNLGV